MIDTDREPVAAGGEWSLVVVDPSRRNGFEPAAVAEPTGRGVFVTTPDRLGALSALSGPDRDPDRFGHVDVGAGGVRSATATDGAGDPFAPDAPGPGAGAGTGADDGLATDDGPDWYSRVVDPLDLPAVATATDRHATRVAEAAADEGVAPDRVAVHVDALTGLAGRVDGAGLVRFLGVVTGRVRSLGATGVAYLVASADAPVVGRVEPAFDAVYEVTDGGVRVRDADAVGEA